MSNISRNILSSALLQAEQYLDKSDFLQAHKIYLNLINEYQSSAEIYNNLAICAHQLEKPEQAIDYINKALELEPNNALYINQYAQFLSSYNIKNNFKTAKLLFNKALNLIATDKKNPDVKNIQYIKNCYANFLFNTGCFVAKELNTDMQQQAIDLFTECLNYQPNNDKAIFNIACCYINLDDVENGVKYLKTTIAINDNHSQAHFALSQYYQAINDIAFAEKHLQLSLDSENINHAHAEFNYGVLEQKRNNLTKALTHYQNCLLIDNNHFAACYNLGSIYQKQQNIPQALTYYKKASIIKPEDSTCQYLIACLNNNQNNIQKAPSEYIENLFNSYAENFDAELLNNLNYKTHELLYKLFIASTNYKSNNKLNILDLGCGTGLCGEAFKSLAINLTGVDISANMLEIASKKNIYNNLIKSDLDIFLKNKKLNITHNFDLVILADVLVYYGELIPLFENIKHNLSENGYILFSTELLESNQGNLNYYLNKSGRYSHHIQYIKNIMQQYDFKIIKYSTEVIRTQNNINVLGVLFLVQSANRVPSNL